MEMISTSRYRGLLERWRNRQQFDNELARLAYLVLTAEKQIKHPLMEENNSGNFAILVMGSNRGLCGGFNNKINHLIDVHIKRAKRFRKNLKVYAAGKKAISYLRSKNIPAVKEYTDFDEIPTPEQVDKIADSFIEQYEKKQIDYFGVVYTRFFSLASQQAQTLSVLPVADLIDDLTTRATVIWPWRTNASEFELTPSINEMFNSLVYMMIRSALSGCFLDSALSEHLARVIAMRSATENAENMLKELQGEYNRARQGQITGDLMDIIGGVEAMK
jgi:F-type H+-transporting ATPase subunit gamma